MFKKIDLKIIKNYKIYRAPYHLYYLRPIKISSSLPIYA